MLPVLDHSRPLRLTTLCALYAAQGIPNGFVLTGLKTFLIDRGMSTTEVGTMVAMVSWPWALKWCWGPLIDRFQSSAMGRRRPWVLLAQLGMILAMGAILLTVSASDGVRLLIAMVLLVNIFASLQDVSVDAMAIDLLPEKERGVANGFMYGSSYVGSFVGAAVVGGTLLASGVAAAFAIQAVFLGFIALFPLLLRESRSDAFFSWRRRLADQSPHKQQESIRGVANRLIEAFSIRSSLLCALLAVLSLIAINAHAVFWASYLQRSLDWSAEEFLLLEGGFAVWFGLGGSLAGGFIASTAGAKRTVAVSIVFLSLIWLSYALLEPYWENRALISGLYLVGTAAAGLSQVAMFSLFMGVCWPPVAATQFTAYMAMLNLSNALGANLAGFLEQALPMQSLFLLMVVLQAVPLGVLWGVDPEEVRRKLGETLPAIDHLPADGSS